MSSGGISSRIGPQSPWRAAWLHGGLLLLALAGAWLSFVRPFGDGEPGAVLGVVVVQATEAEVEGVVLEREGSRLEIEARNDAAGRWFAGREGADTVFAGGRQAAMVWQELAPLRAVRALEGVDAAKLPELGLAGGDAPAEFLTVRVRGRDVRFRLGGRPFGGSDRYATVDPVAEGQNDGEGRVLVLPSEVVAGLAGGAELLMERRLLAVSRPEVRAMSLERPGPVGGQGGDGPLRILQRRGAGPADAWWTVEGSEDEDVALAAWADKFFRLSVVSYRSGDPAPDWRREASVAVEADDGEVSTLRIWSAPAGDGRVWLARSPFTRMVAELAPSLAEEVCADLGGLLR